MATHELEQHPRTLQDSPAQGLAIKIILGYYRGKSFYIRMDQNDRQGNQVAYR